MFEIVPHILDRVEIRPVRRQPCDQESSCRAACEKCFDHLTTLNRCAAKRGAKSYEKGRDRAGSGCIFGLKRLHERCDPDEIINHTISHRILLIPPWPVRVVYDTFLLAPRLAPEHIVQAYQDERANSTQIHEARRV